MHADEPIEETAGAEAAATQPFDEAFESVPATAGGHFVLGLYAAVFRLVDHVRRLSELGGASLEEVFERFPFLAEYFLEMRGQMPEELTWEGGTDWWREAIGAFEGRCRDAPGHPSHLPLLAVDAVLLDAGRASSGPRQELAFAGRLAFLAVGLVEEDSRFGTLFAELQEPLPYRRPTLELVGQMMLDEVQ
ncbi:MAG: hypothetical protein MI919_12870, partial [Holophagales bacterium]|nr:hypothetical protein [Holophagales bacterium]